MGDEIHVSGEGLHTLAAQCDAAAVALANSATPSVAGLPTQATVTSVAVGHKFVEATATVLAARIAAAGTNL